MEDDGEIIGVGQPDKIQEKLANSISNRISPQIIPDISTVKVKNKHVIVIQVEQLYGPFYLRDKGLENGVFVRVGNTNHLASIEMQEELMRMGRYASFDKMPCEIVQESDLDLTLVNRIFAEHGKIINTEKMLSLGILTKRGRRVFATNGGVILFGKPVIRERFFPYAEVSCARFSGDTRAEFIDRLNISGGVLQALEEAPKFIRRNTKMAGKFGEMQRRDVAEYPIAALREALVNAIAHANYEISGSRIFIAIYDDRLEIQNPGIMPIGMSIDQFKAGVSRIRNPVIARTLRELNLIEEWGSGYKRIKYACEQGGYKLPLWEEFGTALRVTFHPHEDLNRFIPIETKLGSTWD